MKKLYVAIAGLFTAMTVVGGAFAAFTSTANANHNLFQAGTLLLQLTTVANPAVGGHGGDPAGVWNTTLSDVWTSPVNWKPGDSFTDTLFIRDAGTIDSINLNWNAANLVNAGGSSPAIHMSDKVILTAAQYDENGDGTYVRDILPALKTAYSGGNPITLTQLYTGINVTPFNVEGVGNILPGSVTNAALGGTNGTGKGLRLTWQFDPTADNNYQGATAVVNFSFAGQSN